MIKMKSICLLLAISLVFTSCGDSTLPNAGPVPADELASTQDFVASPDQDTASHIPLYIHKIPAASELNDTITSVGSVGPLPPPPMARIEAQALCRSYWVVEGYADSRASRPQKIAATGQWIQCFPDGTFKGGHWDKQTHSGKWHLTFQEKHPLLQLDSNVDRMDASWTMQLSRDQAKMALTRRNGFGPHFNSISSLWVELYDRPTREQFKNAHQGL